MQRRAVSLRQLSYVIGCFFFEKQTNERRQRYRQSSGSTKYIAVVVGVDFTRMRRWIDCADEANSDCSSKDG